MSDRPNHDGDDREPPQTASADAPDDIHDIDDIDDIDGLLAPYALDAVDDLERQRVERFLAADTVGARDARRDLERYEDAIAAYASLVVEEVEPPTGTWDAIAAATASSANVSTVPVGPTAGRRRRARVFAAAVAAVVLVVTGIVGATLLGGGNGGDDLTRRFEAASAQPGARRGTLEGTAGVAEVVVEPAGRGYLRAAGLASVADGRVYQLWQLDGEVPMSLGVLEVGEGSIATFQAPAGSTTLALSVESAPGAQQPTLPPVAVATLR